MRQNSSPATDHSVTVPARRIVLLGPPGAGKSSQGQRLAAETGLIYLTTGDLFRAAMAAGDEPGRQVRQYVESGDLVPDALVETVVSAHLGALGESPAFILDGFPRDIGQAAWLDRFLIERGVPMLLGGDEFRRTQRGNNNAYCQDNEISWYDWSFLDRHQEIYRLARGMIAFRQAHPVLRKEEFYPDADIRWFGPQGTPPTWLDPHERGLACLIPGQGEPGLYLMFNASTEATTFALPAPPQGGRWHLAVDTFRPTPHGLRESGEELLLENQAAYEMGPRAGTILVACSQG